MPAIGRNEPINCMSVADPKRSFGFPYSGRFTSGITGASGFIACAGVDEWVCARHGRELMDAGDSGLDACGSKMVTKTETTRFRGSDDTSNFRPTQRRGGTDRSGSPEPLMKMLSTGMMTSVATEETERIRNQIADTSTKTIRFSAVASDIERRGLFRQVSAPFPLGYDVSTALFWRAR